LRQQLSLSEGGAIDLAIGSTIFNTEAAGPVHDAIRHHPGYVCSEYYGRDLKSGDVINGIRHEDLQRLSFADDSLDVVLSSDVLEHMPSPYEAHVEIFRVLRPGGRHLFTVPFWPWIVKDDVRAELIDGEIRHLAEPAFHGDPVRPGEGILVWTIFGLEMLVRLADIGFKPSAWNLHEPKSGIVGNWSIVFEAFKPIV
jgi:SAM-dependent methyltransferase